MPLQRRLHVGALIDDVADVDDAAARTEDSATK
jgi:hypothetical protein